MRGGRSTAFCTQKCMRHGASHVCTCVWYLHKYVHLYMKRAYTVLTITLCYKHYDTLRMKLLRKCAVRLYLYVRTLYDLLCCTTSIMVRCVWNFCVYAWFDLIVLPECNISKIFLCINYEREIGDFSESKAYCFIQRFV